MMRGALGFFLLVTVLVVAGSFLMDHPGQVELTWMGYEIETSVTMLLLLLGLLLSLVWFFSAALRGLWRLFNPRDPERRLKRGHGALNAALVALAAGQPDRARKLVAKAEKALDRQPILLLLEAQAAQLAGDEDGARTAFRSLAAHDSAGFLGVRGLLVQALKRGDHDGALDLARRAVRLQPKSSWTQTTLFSLEARQGQWGRAEATLSQALRQGAIPKAEGKRHQAAILTARARLAQAADENAEATRFAAEAARAEPGFVPAAATAAGLLRAAGKDRAAAKVIQRAWKIAPHPELAAQWSALWPEAKKVSRYRKTARLAALQPEHLESRLLLAEAGLGAGLWGEARQQLRLAQEAGEDDRRMFECLARLEEAEHKDAGAAEGWRARARAARPDATWLCDDCGAPAGPWQAVCPGCGAFDSLVWDRPRLGARGDAQALPAAPRLLDSA